MKQGFYTALGTPLDEGGRLCVQSYEKQIEAQIAAGASGVLAMGSMGMLGCVPDGQYEAVIDTVCRMAAGRCRVLVGVSDNSLARVRDRMEIVNRYPVDVAVLTAPYYFQMDYALENFFRKAAAMTEKEVYLYDHQPITKHKITYPLLQRLRDVKNLKGIKSADLALIKALFDDPDFSDFLPIFSGSDLFVLSNLYGVKNYLDGIFACFPATIKRVQDSFDREDYAAAKKWLGVLMDGRDRMLALGIWPAFSYAMNLLGYPGNHAPDYEPELNSDQKEEVRRILVDSGEKLA